MSLIDNKIDWCLKKAEKELKESGKHKGLVKIKPDVNLARAHIKKAEHNLKAIVDFKNIGYSDWSASAAFYSIYHCLLAIISKFGYESRNQECTFALIYYLIETKKIDLDKRDIEKIHILKPEEQQEQPSVIDIREAYQYGVDLTINDNTFKKLLETAKIILDKTKEIIEV